MATFSSLLNGLRASAQLTNCELARLADVPESLISGLQNDNRRVGEYQARKIGKALKLSGEDLEQFVYAAIDTCTVKVMANLKAYPAQLLNSIAGQLYRAGIAAEAISDCIIEGGNDQQNITISLHSGKKATVRTHLTCV